jgi:hypothetical protein
MNAINIVTDDFYFVERITDAASHQEIAGVLLSIPDAIVHSHGAALSKACRAANFTDGARYLTMRAVSLDARRDRQGNLPRAVVLPMEAYRAALAGLAASPSP